MYYQYNVLIFIQACMYFETHVFIVLARSLIFVVLQGGFSYKNIYYYYQCIAIFQIPKLLWLYPLHALLIQVARSLIFVVFQGGFSYKKYFNIIINALLNSKF